MDRKWSVGECWLYCERDGVHVLWLGPVQENGSSAPFYTCADCLDRLRTKFWRHMAARDSAPAR